MEIAAGAMRPLLFKLGQLLAGEYQLEKRVTGRIKSLETELDLMHATLRKVGELPPDMLDEQVRVWAGMARDLSYDMEDAVDAFMVRVEEGRGHDHGSPNNMKNKIKKFLKRTTKLFSKGKALHQISRAIQEAQDRAKELAELHERYDFTVQSCGNNGAAIDPRLTAMYRDVTELVGVDHKRDELIKKLTTTDGDDEESVQQLRTISIVGSGGLGKTTLAQAVYNKMKAQFDCGAFVSVSRNPHMQQIFKKILYELDKSRFASINEAVRDEAQLIDQLRRFLHNKRYLIVIDDLWDENSWELIKCSFPGSTFGSRIITTTRKVSVSKACCSSDNDTVYNMKPLSHGDSKALFYKRIFPQGTSCPRELEEVSTKILKTCDGIPLAIITIASLLANQQVKTKDQWCNVLKSIGRGLAGDNVEGTHGDTVEKMQAILALGYYDLPPHLMTCLLYLMIRRWIAEGFIQHTQAKTSLYELGESYFNELINRSMIQPAIIKMDWTVNACRVHDMVLDLLCSLSRKENFVTILDGTERRGQSLQTKVHRLSMQKSSAEINRLQLETNIMPQVRSLTIFSPAISQMPSLSSFRVLRVLDLEGSGYIFRQGGDSGYDGGKIDLKCVGYLLHLRYLRLSQVLIDELPTDIGKLRFLETLDTRGTGIKELPSSIVRLIRLMFLNVGMDAKLPVGMGKLTSLEELTLLGAFNPDMMKELIHLTQLRVLAIRWEESSVELQKALVDSLGNLQKLQSLDIYFEAPGIDSLLEGFVPSPQLRRFKSKGSSGFLTLPAWINSSSLPLLSRLEIWVGEVRPEDIQVLGMLPALRSLFLAARVNIQEQEQRLGGFVGTADAFPCATECKFFHFPTVPSMFPRGAMPKVQSLEFSSLVGLLAGGRLDLGMGHLPSLEHVKATLWRADASHEEVKEVEAALRLAADAHPNCPRIDFHRWDYRLSDIEEACSSLSDPAYVRGKNEHCHFIRLVLNSLNDVP
ncbi:unnamed protein product [Alopecurus aequalis]